MKFESRWHKQLFHGSTAIGKNQRVINVCNGSVYGMDARFSAASIL